MATFQDSSLGTSTTVESTYGTGQTIARWYEFKSESLDYTKNTKQGQGMRVTTRVARSGRRTVPTFSVGGDFDMELVTKGMGVLWQWALGGTSTSTAVGSGFQQVHTLGTSVTAPALTFQKGIVNNAGTVVPFTFQGVSCSSFEINCPNGDIVDAKFSVFGRSIDQGTTAYVSPVMTANPVTPFTFLGGTISVGTGALTAPTTIALASLATPLNLSVRDFSLKVDNKLAVDRFNFGAAGKVAQPTDGLRDISGSMTVEFDNLLSSALLSDTDLAVVLNFVSTEAIAGLAGGGFANFQIVLPAIRINSEVPKADNTDLVTVKIDFDVLDNGSATQPLWIIQQTADSAL